ncbi:MAG: response regulator transcription factor [Spirochaetes bacterium]|nr:response regulator transcription factor [Spirochaetota bacterium]
MKGAGAVGDTILYADDEPRYLRLVKLFLEREGYEVLTAGDGRSALEALGRRPDTALVILDMMMPGMDGLGACRAIRSFSRVPILMLTALGDEPHEIRGIDTGADDYLAKPFSRDLLCARVRALLRRARAAAPDVLSGGGVTLDTGTREVAADGQPVALSFREFELLRHLMDNMDTVCPRERILDQVWGWNYEGDPRTLDTHVKSLRRKLGPAGGLVVTCRGVGYSFRRGIP